MQFVPVCECVLYIPATPNVIVHVCVHVYLCVCFTY